MDNQLTNIGIVRESRNDENRTPLVPEHIKKYKESNPNINFIIQPSNNRCFSDEEYELSGAKINENLNKHSIKYFCQNRAHYNKIKNVHYGVSEPIHFSTTRQRK